MSRGKHRKPNAATRTIARIAVAGVALGAPFAIAAAPAQASPDWDAIAQCESGGNWSINTGNGYYGGLQFSESSWQAVGGSGLPHQHSREEQIKRGKILQSQQGWGAWPSCSAQLGLT
jgi:resuscitation-promoting factor RpfA